MSDESQFPRRQAFSIALASFSNCITSPIFSAFVPLLLSRRFTSTAVIGAILTGCNLLSILAHPLIGGLSDRTGGRFGRRRPYILAGAVVCGLSFACIPRLENLIALMLCLCIYCFSIASWRAPTSALMIDTIPAPFIGKSNAIMSCMVAASSCAAYFLGNIISSMSGQMNLLFGTVGLVCIAAAIAACIGAKETPSPVASVRAYVRLLPDPLPKDGRSRLLLLLGMVLTGYIGYSAYEYYFVLFSRNVLDKPAAFATLLLGLGMVGYLVFSASVSALRRTLPPDKMVRFGITLLTLLFAATFTLSVIRVNGASMLSSASWVLYPFCILCGIGWASFNVFTLPLLLRYSGNSENGSFMGYFFICTGVAMVFAPLLYGIVRDLTQSYATVFLFAALLFSAARICLALSARKELEQE